MFEALRPRGPAIFYLDFALFPTAAIAIVAMECRTLGWAFEALAGALLFSFGEYWVHRVALHRFFYHGVHEVHHRQPWGYSLLPVWLTPAFFGGCYFAMPLPLYAGFIIGYCWFLIWHHLLHHFDLSGLRHARHYALWHLRHHHDDDCNFGITLPIWDFLFRTHRKAA